MTVRWWLALYRPPGYDPAGETAEMRRAISALNEAMQAAGVRRLACGLHPPARALTLRRGADGGVHPEQGPCTAAEEQVCGFWIIDADDATAAMQWAEQAAHACRGTVEVRALHG